MNLLSPHPSLTFLYLVRPEWVPVCNACISFSEFTSCHNLSSWDFTLSSSAAASQQRGKKKKQVKLLFLLQTHYLWSVCDVHSYLQPDEVKRPSWCEMDGWSWSGARRSKERGRQGGPDVPCLRPVDPTGQDTVAHLVVLWKEPKPLQAAQYILDPLYAFLGTLLALAPTLFVFVQTSGGGERGIRVEWQIMISLCLAFDKYLLGTRCAGQYSL